MQTVPQSPASGNGSQSKWPENMSVAFSEFDATREASVLASGHTEQDLRSLCPERPRPEQCGERIIDALFPGNPLLCMGKNRSHARTAPREFWQGKEFVQQLIVPNPMTQESTRKPNGRKTYRCRAITGQRRFIVIEFDAPEWEELPPEQKAQHGTRGDYLLHLRDKSAAKLLYLAKFAPLCLVVYSGNKSTHGWFYCAGIPEPTVRAFINHAVTIGADGRLFLPEQWVRMPDGVRDGSIHQPVFFFNPAALEGKAPEGLAGTWTVPQKWIDEAETSVKERKAKGLTQEAQGKQVEQELQEEQEEQARISGVTDSVLRHAAWEEIVSTCLPRRKHDTDGKLFRLSRAAKMKEGVEARRFSLVECREKFNIWAHLARPFLTQTDDEYFSEFMRAFENVRYPLGMAAVGEVWHRLKAGPPIRFPELEPFGSAQGLHDTAAFCRELQKLDPVQPFFLGCRTLGELAGVSHVRASEWLMLLASKHVGFLVVVKKGSGNDATDYRYLKPLN